MNQIEELTKDIERKEQALTEKHIILSHDACKDKIEELKSIIRASDQQTEEFKTIIKASSTSERKAKSDLTPAIKDLDELKQEVKIQASIAAKAELNLQVS